MKKEVIDLFTKRIIDYSLIDWFELILVILLLTIIYAIIKSLVEK